jgi:pyruvate, water dikinase
VVTFDGLIERTPFVAQMRVILRELQLALKSPVDVEFAHDGTHLYLLQCRPQARSRDDAAVSIPKNVPERDIVFSANRYVSNGRVPDLSYVVYVDPLQYGELANHDDLWRVGEVVSRLNGLLPRRQFALLGPGRWGSRGDVKLGVRVTYSDISNTALLVEVARKKGSYVPDVSFGTHFFQDLVDSSIRYLPLYPDDDGVHFNEAFLLGATNLLPGLLPDYAALEATVRVVDVRSASGGRILRVVMNADEGVALGYLAAPD